LWLYIPEKTLNQSIQSQALHSAPDLAAWSSVSQSQNPDTELFVLSSGKLIQRLLSWRGWKTRHWIMRLSGLTLKPSTAAHGVAKWISSLPDIPASRSHSQACEKVRPTHGIFGRMLRVLSKRCSRNGCSAKTSKAISLWDFPKSPENYKQWALTLKRACSRRMKQEQAIRGGVFSCWPTPTAQMNGNRAELAIGTNGLFFLAAQDQTGSQIGLNEAVRTWTLFWLTAKALGMTGSPPPDAYRYSRRLHLSLRPGTRSLAGELTFNPHFSDWIMGWPIGWSDAGQPVTEFHRWLQHSRTTHLKQLLTMDK